MEYEFRCGFCGRKEGTGKGDVRVVVHGQNANICNECADRCQALIQKDEADKALDVLFCQYKALMFAELWAGTGFE